MVEDRRLLHEKFNLSRAPPWQAMTNHMPPGTNRDEITASLADVLGRADRFMMILSGYENTPDWNAALADFIATRPVTATFIRAEGDAPAMALRALLHSYAELREDTDSDPVDLARVAIMNARDNRRMVKAGGPPPA